MSTRIKETGIDDEVYNVGRQIEDFLATLNYHVSDVHSFEVRAGVITVRSFRRDANGQHIEDHLGQKRTKTEQYLWEW